MVFVPRERVFTNTNIDNEKQHRQYHRVHPPAAKKGQLAATLWARVSTAPAPPPGRMVGELRHGHERVCLHFAAVGLSASGRGIFAHARRPMGTPMRLLTSTKIPRPETQILSVTKSKQTLVPYRLDRRPCARPPRALANPPRQTRERRSRANREGKMRLPLCARKLRFRRKRRRTKRAATSRKETKRGYLTGYPKIAARLFGQPS